MHMDVLTLFPEMIEGVFNDSILKKHRKKRSSVIISLIFVTTPRINI